MHSLSLAFLICSGLAQTPYDISCYVPSTQLAGIKTGRLVDDRVALKNNQDQLGPNFRVAAIRTCIRSQQPFAQQRSQLLGHQLAVTDYANLPVGSSPQRKDVFWLPGVGITQPQTNKVQCETYFIPSDTRLNYVKAEYTADGLEQTYFLMSNGDFLFYGQTREGKKVVDSEFLFSESEPLTGFWGYETTDGGVQGLGMITYQSDSCQLAPVIKPEVPKEPDPEPVPHNATKEEYLVPPPPIVTPEPKTAETKLHVVQATGKGVTFNWFELLVMCSVTSLTCACILCFFSVWCLTVIPKPKITKSKKHQKTLTEATILQPSFNDTLGGTEANLLQETTTLDLERQSRPLAKLLASVEPDLQKIQEAAEFEEEYQTNNHYESLLNQIPDRREDLQAEEAESSSAQAGENQIVMTHQSPMQGLFLQEDICLNSQQKVTNEIDDLEAMVQEVMAESPKEAQVSNMESPQDTTLEAALDQKVAETCDQVLPELWSDEVKLDNPQFNAEERKSPDLQQSQEAIKPPEDPVGKHPRALARSQVLKSRARKNRSHQPPILQPHRVQQQGLNREASHPLITSSFSGALTDIMYVPHKFAQVRLAMDSTLEEADREKTVQAAIVSELNLHNGVTQPERARPKKRSGLYVGTVSPNTDQALAANLPKFVQRQSATRYVPSHRLIQSRSREHKNRKSSELRRDISSQILKFQQRKLSLEHSQPLPKLDFTKKSPGSVKDLQFTQRRSSGFKNAGSSIMSRTAVRPLSALQDATQNQKLPPLIPSVQSSLVRERVSEYELTRHRKDSVGRFRHQRFVQNL